MGDEMYSLFMEYEEGKTEESKFVKQLDKFEMVVQAYEYEKAQNKNLNDFYKSTEGVWEHPQIKGWMEFLKKKRSQLTLPSEPSKNNALKNQKS